MAYETGDDNRLTTDGAYAYQYDAEGNRTRRYVDEDESGDYSAGDTDVTEYAWDHRNRLTNVKDYDGNGMATTSDDTLVQEVTYTYDAFNQLISRSVDTDGDTGSAYTVDSFYYWENGQIVLEFDDDVAYEHGTLNMSDLGHRYLWGSAVDQLLADENASTNVITWPLPDHLGTIRDWVNNSGTNLDHVEYDTSGRRIDTAAIDEVFGRAGLFHDKYTGNDYARNRWLDPETGRWLSQDPIGFHGGSFSLYVYAGNATTVATDPSGLAPPRQDSLRQHLNREVDDWGYGPATGWSVIDVPAAGIGSFAGNLLGKPAVWLWTHWRDDTRQERCQVIQRRQDAINGGRPLMWGAWALASTSTLRHQRTESRWRSWL